MDSSEQVQPKDTASSGLHKELAQLRNALAQTRSRCEALERQNMLTERESAILSEEKNNLTKQSEALTTQIQELTKAREELQQQILADGAQWRRIMAMSSKLQVQGVEDSRILREERESWEQERLRYESRIRLLKNQGDHEGETASSSGGNSGSRADVEPVEQMSGEGLVSEVKELRGRVRELETILSSVSQESEQIAITTQSLNEIRQRIASISKVGTIDAARASR